MKTPYFVLKKFVPKEITRPVPRFTVTELEKRVMGTTWEKVHEITSRQESTRLAGPILGNVVHAVLKNIGPKTTPDIPTKLRKALFEQGVIATEEEGRAAGEMIEGFLASDIAPPRFDGLHELPFSLKFPKACIMGTIDYALETDRGWVIYDFKTDSRMEPEKYRLQMDVYALALSLWASEKPILQTELLFLRQNKKSVQGCSPQRLQETEKKLIEFTEKMGF